ncbi:efflux RND transporter periplasmic adaptor subunit [Halomonas alkaliantarctica]|uniref:Efflux RND transporter periplasmic adaptor subunit n=1 Tax=Halomonas alkaliantarctica TaxID=232346 RepID=A0ABY8LP43_9GAMM|nr:efflux RND transporter periplasmic adaptor subunit [Halomonas alkaliantarctica]WGI26183.1 efflux RND transporter periplasmic adaptor subunit [Halomonas alkaliantarctica]
MKIRYIYNGCLCALLLSVLTACGPVEQEAVAPPPARVSVVTMEPVKLELTDDLPARVVPFQVAEIHPQVSGIVQRRLFEQGTDVSAGQPLFDINPAPFRAEVETAEAALQKAEAELAHARSQSARLESLVRGQSVSRQAYDDAVSNSQQAAAEVAQARATLSRRRLDLEFSTVASPIAGRIDQALVTEGALVSSSDSTPMARVQQIDQVYVDVRRSASALESLQDAIAAQPSLDSGLPVTILGSNGTPYDVTGHLLFSGINVDVSTGDLLLRVLVDNPNRRLLPGMFVRARVPYARYDKALTVPQQSVVRIGGKPYVWVVDAQEQVTMVAVQLGEVVEGSYRVQAGLTQGQKVVVEGIERLADGAAVSATDWHRSSPLEASVASSY